MTEKWKVCLSVYVCEWSTQNVHQKATKRSDYLEQKGAICLNFHHAFIVLFEKYSCYDGDNDFSLSGIPFLSATIMRDDGLDADDISKFRWHGKHKLELVITISHAIATIICHCGWHFVQPKYNHECIWFAVTSTTPTIKWTKYYNLFRWVSRRNKQKSKNFSPLYKLGCSNLSELGTQAIL